jgi:hypothetical protein
MGSDMGGASRRGRVLGGQEPGTTETDWKSRSAGPANPEGTGGNFDGFDKKK